MPLVAEAEVESAATDVTVMRPVMTTVADVTAMRPVMAAEHAPVVGGRSMSAAPGAASPLRLRRVGNDEHARQGGGQGDGAIAFAYRLSDHDISSGRGF